MGKLIAQMVIRNEADRYLEEVLQRLTSQVDEIIITDDYSDDDSFKIAQDFTDKLQRMPEPTFVKNEGVLRQTAWDFMSQFATDGDWILAIDADEKFYPGPDLRIMMEQTNYHVLGIQFFHMWNRTHYRVDKAWAPNISSRLFRWKAGGDFSKKRLASGSEPSYVLQDIRQGRFNPRTGWRMQHLGYMRDDDKQAKYDRYMELDKGDFHSLNHLKSIIDTNPKLEPWT